MTSPVSAAPTVRECSGQSVVFTRTVANGPVVAGLITLAGLLGFP